MGKTLRSCLNPPTTDVAAYRDHGLQSRATLHAVIALRGYDRRHTPGRTCHASCPTARLRLLRVHRRTDERMLVVVERSATPRRGTAGASCYRARSQRRAGCAWVCAHD